MNSIEKALGLEAGDLVQIQDCLLKPSKDSMSSVSMFQVKERKWLMINTSKFYVRIKCYNEAKRMLPAMSFQEILFLPFLLMRGDKFLIGTFSCLFYIQVGKGKKLSWVLFNLWFEENMFSVKLSLCYTRQWGFSVAQTIRNLPVMWETWVWSLGLEGPLEKGMATHCSVPP